MESGAGKGVSDTTTDAVTSSTATVAGTSVGTTTNPNTVTGNNNNNNNSTSTANMVTHTLTSTTNSLRNGDKYFLEQRNLLLQNINMTMDSILNGLNELNISIENSISVGKEFESVTNLWKNFYNENSSVLDEDDSVNFDESVEDSSIVK